MKAAIALGLVLLTLGAFMRTGLVRQTVQEGEVWRQDNLSAPFVFAIEKAPEVRAAEVAEIRTTTPPVFHEVPDYRAAADARADSLLAILDETLSARARQEANRSRGLLEEAASDSIAYERLKAASGLPLSAQQWRLLSASYNERVPGVSTTSRDPRSGPRLDLLLMLEATAFAVPVLEAGIIDVPKDSIRAPEIEVRVRMGSLLDMRPTELVRDKNEALREGREVLLSRFPGRVDTVRIGLALLGRVIQPNLIYDPLATQAEWRIREESLSPTENRVRLNEVIVRRGEVITPLIQRKIASLDKALNERRGARLIWQTVSGQLMLTLAIFVWFFLYLFVLRRQIFEDNRLILLLAILFALIIVMFGAALRIPAIDMYMVPVAIASVLMTVIFDSRVAIFGLVVLALIGSVLLGMDLVYFMSTLFAGTLAVFSVRDIRNRAQFFISAGVVFLGYGIILLSAFLLESTSLERFLDQLLFVAVNAVLVLLSYGFLWVFERIFGVTTDVTLLELSDTNSRLLKEVSLKAPGTFNHSLQVANLAEAASAAIGANSLLTRVGALYHDIGKMEKPEYFVENQRGGINPHDQLKPRMSALIIASHVKEGLALGEASGLPAAVTKFIPMHHGTTRIEYFYRRAKDESDGDGPKVMESDFRYPGPRPDSKETAILMLADSVEAASRTVDNPTHKKLKTLINALVDARIDDHQLDDTDLTFRDITKIKETFLNLLVGQFHARVKYPGESPAAEADSEGAAVEAGTPTEAPEEGSESVQDGPGDEPPSVGENGADSVELRGSDQ
ncbi:MAG: HDIG domain-containing protein [Rhodothermales bacterium]|nr:HDIG domain-containing protein [Rhodothermales bacterium]